MSIRSVTRPIPGLLIASLWLSSVVAACGSDESTFAPASAADGGSDGGTTDPTFAEGFGGEAQRYGNDEGGTCAELNEPAKLEPLDLFFMIDVSGSMHFHADATASKWDKVKPALDEFADAPTSKDIGFGVDFFPQLPGNGPQSCAATRECPNQDCVQRYCANVLVPTLCDGDADCRENAEAPVPTGACTALGICDGNKYYRCNANTYCTTGDADWKIKCGKLGEPCTAGVGGSTTDVDGFPYGTCVPATRSQCGLSEFLGGAPTCTRTDYATPDVMPTHGNGAKLKEALIPIFPNGGTPTYPALAGALDAAVAFKNEHQDEVVAVVFTTDGVPTACFPEDAGANSPAVAALAKNAFDTAGVRTYVIGVFNDTEKAKAESVLNPIAAAGRTGTPFIVSVGADTTTQFANALAAIRLSARSCVFDLPKPPAGRTPDYGKVNVEYESGTDSKVLAYVETEASCDAASGGWYYDIVPTPSVTPTKVNVCPATCTRLKNDANGTLGIRQGCVATNTVPPIF
jgi:hypothetical protein